MEHHVFVLAEGGKQKREREEQMGKDAPERTTYDRKELLLLGEEFLSSGEKYRVSESTWTALTSFGLGTIKPTKRGKRRGGNNIPKTAPPNTKKAAEKVEIGAVQKTLRLGYFNARSACYKSSDIIAFIEDQKLDICTIAETWLSTNEKSQTANQ